jgi:hypothetical protein
MRGAAAGAVAAAVWGVCEPLWQRALGTSYSDVGVLRPFVPRPRAVHVLNGALFGLAYDELRARTGRDGPGFAIAVALAENTSLWPLVALLDRKHATSIRAFACASVGHAFFGALLGVLAAKR